MRASGKDDAIKLTPAIKYTLEQALDFIEDDELVEVTPEGNPPAQEVPHRKRPQARLARRLIRASAVNEKAARWAAFSCVWPEPAFAGAASAAPGEDQLAADCDCLRTISIATSSACS